jgi:hypothetical protein
LNGLYTGLFRRVNIENAIACWPLIIQNSLSPVVASLVRAMNCYYSNLTEGHDTHPVDIERALKNDYSKDARKRHLQLEAKAQITVQKWIDGGGLTGRAVTSAGICEVHRRFCDELPDDLLWVQDPATKERVRVVPGELRRKHVLVGAHIAVSPAAVARFLRRFEEVYGAVGKASIAGLMLTTEAMVADIKEEGQKSAAGAGQGGGMGGMY